MQSTAILYLDSVGYHADESKQQLVRLSSLSPILPILKLSQLALQNTPFLSGAVSDIDSTASEQTLEAATKYTILYNATSS